MSVVMWKALYTVLMDDSFFSSNGVCLFFVFFCKQAIQILSQLWKIILPLIKIIDSILLAIKERQIRRYSPDQTTRQWKNCPGFVTFHGLLVSV